MARQAVLASLLSLGVWAAAAAPASAAPPERVAVIVQLQPGADVDAQAQRVADQGGTVFHRYRTAFRGFAVELNETAIESLRRNPQVVSVERDAPVQATATQSDPVWGLDRIDQRNLPLSDSYTYPNAGTGVSAYVLDTGILAEHVDFGNRVRSGFTAISDRRGTSDCDGHGTHVAGTIGGTTYGVAKDVSLVAVRVLNCRGSGTISGVIAGVDWTAADHVAGAPAVANMSLGGGVSSSLDTAVRNLVADGVTVSLAAGNSDVDACGGSPARVTEGLTVAASTQTDGRASFSNYGTCVDLFAPGVEILSDWYRSTDATATLSGTSMAAPHVAGAAAILLSQQPGLSPAEVAGQMLTSATGGVVTDAGPGTPNLLLYVG